MLPLILSLAIITGQVIKLPLGVSSGPAVIDIVVLLLDIFFLVKLRFRLPKSPLWVKSAFLFVAVAILSLILSPLNLTPTERLIGFFYILRFSSIILLGWLININVSRALLISGVILSIFGLFQFIFLPDLSFLSLKGWDPHYFRTVSTFLDPNFLGAYLVLTLLLLHSVILNSFQDLIKMPKRVRHDTLFFIIVYLALLTTFSRGAYLAFLVAFLTLSFIKKSIKLGLITIFLFGILMLSFYWYHQGVAAPKGIDRGQSAEARLDTWQQGIQIFLENPLLGVGFNVYRQALREYKLSDEGFLTSHGASSNDSSLLFVAATTGIIGFFAYLFFLGTCFFQGKKKPILLAGLMGLLAQSFFANTLFYPYLLLWLVVVSGFEPETSSM